MNLRKVKTLLGVKGTQLAIDGMAREIVHRFKTELDKVILVGIRRRGVPLAYRLAEVIFGLKKVRVAIGEADTNFYTDELTLVASVPLCKGIDLPRSGDGQIIILVDDVLYTGRTAFQTLKRVLDMCHPKAVYLAVLIDRGWREMPIEAQFVGREYDTTAEDVVHVHFPETDPEVQDDNADLMRKAEEDVAAVV